MIKKLISKLFGIKECACPEDIWLYKTNDQL
jgi:hypothetical protein